MCRRSLWMRHLSSSRFGMLASMQLPASSSFAVIPPATPASCYDRRGVFAREQVGMSRTLSISTWKGRGGVYTCSRKKKKYGQRFEYTKASTSCNRSASRRHYYLFLFFFFFFFSPTVCHLCFSPSHGISPVPPHHLLKSRPRLPFDFLLPPKLSFPRLVTHLLLTSTRNGTISHGPSTGMVA